MLLFSFGPSQRLTHYAANCFDVMHGLLANCSQGHIKVTRTITRTAMVFFVNKFLKGRTSRSCSAPTSQRGLFSSMRCDTDTGHARKRKLSSGIIVSASTLSGMEHRGMSSPSSVSLKLKPTTTWPSYQRLIRYAFKKRVSFKGQTRAFTNMHHKI